MYRKEKKIPTILALFLLLGGLGIGVYLDRRPQSLTSMANPSNIPVDVQFTNISDSSFTVSWLTAQETTGSVVVSSDVQKLTFLDDGDSDNLPRPRDTHYVTVKNLSEDTSYSVKIISGTNSCKEEQACPVFSQKTAQKLSSTLDLPPAHGVVVDNNNKPQEGAIVYLTVSNNSILSGKTDKLGLWVIPFNNLRTGDFLSRPNLTDSDLIQITVKNSPEGVASAVIDLKSIKQNLAIPDMTIGNSYNFINLISKKDQLAQLNKQNILGAKTSVTNFPTMTKKPEKPAEIDILFPKNDRDFTPDKKPKLRGVARPGSQVLITVKSNPQTGKIKTAKDGTWSWIPPKNLEPGLHEITIQSYDSSGKLVTVTKTFYVLKSGESVLGEATLSGDLITVTCAPSVCLPSPTTIPTTAPTVPSATPAATSPPQSTATTAPTLQPIQPTTPVGTPRSGSTGITTVMFAASATLLFLGAKLLLFP